MEPASLFAQKPPRIISMRGGEWLVWAFELFVSYLVAGNRGVLAIWPAFQVA
jgi:hypothetical protein